MGSINDSHVCTFLFFCVSCGVAGDGERVHVCVVSAPRRHPLAALKPQMRRSRCGVFARVWCAVFVCAGTTSACVHVCGCGRVCMCACFVLGIGMSACVKANRSTVVQGAGRREQEWDSVKVSAWD